MNYTLHLGDCLEYLKTLPTASVDAVITDPPYSSGGFTRSDRTALPGSKYVHTGTMIVRNEFSGDNRDQRSWGYWMTLWLSECLRIVKPSGYALCFSDWRQLPTLTDVLQSGGWVWRGLISWDKGRGARAVHTGYFRHQCEYIAWGTSGVSVPASHGGPFDGSITIPVLQSDKHHMTGKPTKLMSDLVLVVPPGSTVLDPFMGSGTTGVACMQTGRNFIGCEIDPGYFEIAKKRIENAAAQPPLIPHEKEPQPEQSELL